MRNVDDEYSERVKGLGLSFTYLPKHESVQNQDISAADWECPACGTRGFSQQLMQCAKCKTCKPAVTRGGSEKAGRIVIKGIQACSLAAICDSLHVGDELVSISGRAVGTIFLESF